MHTQRSIFKEEPNPSDVVYTPNRISRDIVLWLNPTGLCLDPCRGDGAFYQQFIGEKDYCEIQEGLNFFDYKKKVDWIIGNPPYSIFEQFLMHSFELSPNVCFIVPTNKVFQRQKIMRLINDYGGIKAMRVYGSGSVVGFPFGFSVGAFHFKRNFNGPCHLSLSPRLLGQRGIQNYEDPQG